jgi:hypothetical protein
MGERQVSAIREAGSLQAKRALISARVRVNLGHKEIGDACGFSDDVSKRMFMLEEQDRHMRLGDVFNLAQRSNTRELVNLVVAALQEITAVHELRVCDVEAMSKSDVSDAARMAATLRQAADRLCPEEMLRTSEPANVQTIAIVATGKLPAVAPKRKAKRG